MNEYEDSAMIDELERDCAALERLYMSICHRAMNVMERIAARPGMYSITIQHTQGRDGIPEFSASINHPVSTPTANSIATGADLHALINEVVHRIRFDADEKKKRELKTQAEKKRRVEDNDDPKF